MTGDDQDLVGKIVSFFFVVEEEELSPQFELNSLVLLLTNCSPAEAEHLASVLVREGLAACVNVIPGVTSFYVWEGKFTQDSESTLVIKTVEPAVDGVVRRLRELHSYTTPEIVMLKPNGVNPAYMKWVQEQTRSVE